MKANEYFKKHGYRKCKSACAENGWLNTGFWIQLKRLVESHNLVERIGGLREAKIRLEQADKEFSLLISFRSKNNEIYSVYDHVLKQAIADVESCQ